MALRPLSFAFLAGATVFAGGIVLYLVDAPVVATYLFFVAVFLVSAVAASTSLVENGHGGSRH